MEELQSSLITTLTHKTGLFIFAYSAKHKSLMSWSDNAREILGVKDADILRDANLFLRHVHPDDRFLLLKDLEQALNGKTHYRATYRWIRPDNNEVRWIHCRAESIQHADENIFEGLMIDLSTEFTGAVGTIAGPDSIGTILSAFPTIVFTTDADLRLLRINRPKDQTLFNFGDENFKKEQFKIGRPILSALSDEDLKFTYERIMQGILEGKSNYYRNRISIGEVVFSLEIVPIKENEITTGLLFIVNDISQSVRLERQISDLQKREGLSLLASGVAHNFNNVLQGILGHAAVILSHYQDAELTKHAAQSILEIVSRSSELTRQLLVLDSSGSDKPELIDLNLVGMLAINKIEDLFSSGIRVTVAFGNTDKILARQDDLVEIVLAILKNAKEHLKQGETLAIKTSQVSLNDLEIEDLVAGFYAKLSITDSGSGMTDEERKRCLDPFFTTKEHDATTGVGIKPSGLGLPRAFGLLRKLKGGIEIDSSTGIGTTISIYIPTATQPDQRKSGLVELAHAPEILIIDDDLLVLETVRALLRDLGYSCVTAENSSRAFSILKIHSRTLRLILLDAVMPGMDGASLLHEIRRINKDLKVIGFSGATPDQTRPLLKAGALEILQKPIGPSELQRAIQAALISQAA